MRSPTVEVFACHALEIGFLRLIIARTRMLRNSVIGADSASRKSSRKTEWRGHEQFPPSILEKWVRDCGDRRETIN